MVNIGWFLGSTGRRSFTAEEGTVVRVKTEFKASGL
jgi:hypothetical protein